MPYYEESIHGLDYRNEADREKLFDISFGAEGIDRADALDVLSNWVDERVWERLIEALKDGFDLVRVAAVEGLAYHGKKGDLDRLVPLLDDESVIVAEAVEYALGELGNPKAIPILLSRLDSLRGKERVGVEGALYKLGDNSRLTPILLQLESEDFFTRVRAFNVLAGLVNERNVEEILPALETAANNESDEFTKSEMKQQISEIAIR